MAFLNALSHLIYIVIQHFFSKVKQKMRCECLFFVKSRKCCIYATHLSNEFKHLAGLRGPPQPFDLYDFMSQILPLS